ncbi:MAG: hypothetical protein GC206_13175 [Alphaproteobacteria bacterium]|nr:hypothetical protein [Alphaproteobacteria bacterium]
MPDPWIKVTGATAGDVLKRDPEAKPPADPRARPEAHYAALIEANALSDALAFLALALPSREAVWWAAQALDPDPPPSYWEAPKVMPAPPVLAIRTARFWTVDPTEPNRQAARTVSELAGLGTPEGMVAMAAFAAGPSLATPDLPAVPPPPQLCAVMVRSCLTIHAAKAAETEINDPLGAVEAATRSILDIGVDLATGKRLVPQKAKR